MSSLLLLFSIFAVLGTGQPNRYNSWNLAAGKRRRGLMDDAPQCTVKEVLEPEFRYFAPAKKSVDVIKNRFYTRFEDTIKKTLDPEAQTVFITHGYIGGNAPWAVDIKDALIEKEKCNVFIVDWTGLDGTWYGTAMDNIRVVGEEIGVFVKRLMTTIPDIKPEKIHLIGHSLGAHASGYAGKWIKEQGFKIGRITGLDPAGPDFNELTECERLDRSDADFVDVIHTNWADSFLESVSGFGLEATIGHFDFYPNGGEDQPGCKTASEAELDIGLDLLGYLNTWTLLYKLINNGPEETKNKFLDLACSHGRAYEFFYWSIKDAENGCKFSADECPTWEEYDTGKCATPAEKLPKVQMGYYSAKYKNRIKNQRKWKFFLRTNAKAPFCVK